MQIVQELNERPMQLRMRMSEIMMWSSLSLLIEVGTPVSPDAPLADPGVRNYRTGLLRKRAHETNPDTECQNRLPLQAGSLTQLMGSTWPSVSAMLALLPCPTPSPCDRRYRL